jgi:hypothetical protein
MFEIGISKRNVFTMICRKPQGFGFIYFFFVLWAWSELTKRKFLRIAKQRQTGAAAESNRNINMASSY